MIWSNYRDLTRPHPKWWFRKENESPKNFREIQVGEILFHLARCDSSTYLCSELWSRLISIGHDTSLWGIFMVSIVRGVLQFSCGMGAPWGGILLLKGRCCNWLPSFVIQQVFIFSCMVKLTAKSSMGWTFIWMFPKIVGFPPKPSHF